MTALFDTWVTGGRLKVFLLIGEIHKSGDYVFFAGQTGRDSRTGKVIEGDIEAQWGTARLTHPTKLESRS